MLAAISTRENLEIYRGLLWRRPVLAGLLILSLISLAGLPVSIGFVGKFYIRAAGIEARSWALVAALVIGSAIGLFYYLRIAAVWRRRTAREVWQPGRSLGATRRATSPSFSAP